ncbi:MAG: nucleotidyltransferase [Alphaproteobacteria bacterium]|nr:nucleotidyltransferase [Alphaproteobacteria bacterium]
MVALDLSSLSRALLQLQQGLAEARNAPGDDLRRDGVIQRFEYSYELSVKMLRRYVGMTAASPGSVDAMGFPDLIRTAAEQGLLSRGWPAWRDYRAARGTTSHTYDADKARAVFAVIPAFLEEARHLLARLGERTTRP